MINPGQKEVKSMAGIEEGSIPEDASAEVRIGLLGEKYFGFYELLYRSLAESAAQGASTWQGNTMKLNFYRDFLIGLGLQRQVQQLQEEVRSQYPDWDGLVRTFVNFSNHSGGRFG